MRTALAVFNFIFGLIVLLSTIVQPTMVGALIVGLLFVNGGVIWESR